MDSVRGKLLIAAPSLFDFFRRTVVLVIEHGGDGAFGVVLNRRTDTTVGEAAPVLTPAIPSDDPVWEGGPVSPESMIVLGELEDDDLAAKPVIDGVGVVDPDRTDRLSGRARAYAGHAGWTAGQLESEIEAAAWLIEEASADLVFSERDLWAEVLSRRGGRWSLLATMPPDPSLN